MSRAPNKVEVEHGIPMPGRLDNLPDEYPWAEMEVGDSFKAKGIHKKSLSSRIYRAQKKHAPKKFEYRNLPDGIRVWRVA